MIPYLMNFDLKKIANINQKGLAKYKIDKANRIDKKEKITRLIIDSDDILILRFIFDISNNPKVVKCSTDKDFFWVKYDALFEEYNGLLMLTKSALNTRLNKYVDMGLIERKCVKNENGSFSFFKLTGIKDLVYIPVDSNGNKPVEGQVHIEEVAGVNFNEIQVSANIKEDDVRDVEPVDQEVEQASEEDMAIRVEQVERVLTTKANKRLKEKLKKFKSQEDFYNYFDNILYPNEIEKDKKNTCEYIIKSIELYLCGEMTFGGK